ncbi:MAG TPA: hypothetical protein VMU48_07760 [Terracidiphilus sp.]|nr:hypothetical protein [Terracidiphilus sp.]
MIRLFTRLAAMRHLIFSALFLGAACAALTQATQQPTITIESKKPTFESGQPIQVHIVLKNTTNRKFTVFRSVGGGRGEEYYSINVTGPDGNPATLTEYGTAAQKNVGVVSGSTIMKHLAPGEDTDEYVTISRMFDMTPAGTYVVQASRASPLDPAVILKSNTLMIHVGD